MPSSSVSQLSAQDFAELLSGPLIEVQVGQDGKRWHLHHNLLRHHSKYFDDGQDSPVHSEEERINTSTSTSSNTNITNGRIELPDDDPTAFRILVKWLYQGCISDVSSLPQDAKWDYAFACQNLYLLCTRLEITELRNLAIDQFRKGCHETHLVPGADEILPVYRRTVPGSPFRQLVSRIAARQIMDPDVKRDAGMYGDCFREAPEFAVDVLNAIREGTNGLLLDNPTEGNGCRYHEHGGGESCSKVVHFKDDE